MIPVRMNRRMYLWASYVTVLLVSAACSPVSTAALSSVMLFPVAVSVVSPTTEIGPLSEMFPVDVTFSVPATVAAALRFLAQRLLQDFVIR